MVALKRYGMILADNGSPWYVSGAPDRRWNDDDLHELGRITGARLRGGGHPPAAKRPVGYPRMTP